MVTYDIRQRFALVTFYDGTVKEINNKDTCIKFNGNPNYVPEVELTTLVNRYFRGTVTRTGLSNTMESKMITTMGNKSGNTYVLMVDEYLHTESANQHGVVMGTVSHGGDTGTGSIEVDTLLGILSVGSTVILKTLL